MMTYQTKGMISDVKIKTARRKPFLRAGLFVFLLICGAAIFIFGSYYFDVFPTNKNLTYNLVLCTVFLSVSLVFRFDKRLNKYWQIPFAFFIGSTAFPLTALLSDWIGTVLSLFSVTADTSQGLAIEKTCEMLIKVIPILALVKISGANLESVSIKRGNLKLGMGIGWLVFFFLAPASFMFAVQRFTSTESLTAAVVWGLLFSFANAFMEELWLRGIFLKQFTGLVGEKGSVWITSIIFAGMHSFAYYFMPEALPFFALNTLALGLACGYLMIKSESFLGPTIIHAASDFFLFMAVLASV
jgi:membrane protease YdiL (CAAX protease family)